MLQFHPGCSLITGYKTKSYLAPHFDKSKTEQNRKHNMGYIFN